MFCKKCGNELSEGDAFCHECGARPPEDDNASGRSDTDRKNLPDYVKEYDPHRQDTAGGNSGDGIVRLGVGGKPAKPEEPTGFVNPLRNSVKTIFRDDEPVAAAGVRPPEIPTVLPAKKAPDIPNVLPAKKAPEIPSVLPAKKAPDIPNVLPAKKAPDTAPSDNATGTPPGSGEPTGFVNPLRNSEQDIHWGSDGDRNLNSTGGFYGDESEIESNMGMAIAVTVFGALCCSNCITIILGIVAIIFASQVERNLKTGNYLAAKKNSDTAKLLCWIAIALLALNLILGLVSALIQMVMAFTSTSAPGTMPFGPTP